MPDLTVRIINWIGFIFLLSLFFSYLEKLEKNYVTTLTLLIVLCILYIIFYIGQLIRDFGQLIRDFGIQFREIANNFISAYSSKDTVMSARRHSAAVTTGVIDSINDEGQSGPLCWPLWLPFRFCKRAIPYFEGVDNAAAES
jgi:hypothetical protein